MCVAGGSVCVCVVCVCSVLYSVAWCGVSGCVQGAGWYIWCACVQCDVWCACALHTSELHTSHNKRTETNTQF